MEGSVERRLMMGWPGRSGEKSSPVVRIMREIWESAAAEGVGMRLQGAFRDVLLISARTGLPFELGDFQVMCDAFCGKWWLTSETLEAFYRAAAEHKNISACLLLEKWVKRRAMILEGKRMFVGRQFIWKGDRVKCTSFANWRLETTPLYVTREGEIAPTSKEVFSESFIAVAYEGWVKVPFRGRTFRGLDLPEEKGAPPEIYYGQEGKYSSKVKRRYTITLQELHEEDRERRSVARQQRKRQRDEWKGEAPF